MRLGGRYIVDPATGEARRVEWTTSDADESAGGAGDGTVSDSAGASDTTEVSAETAAAETTDASDAEAADTIHQED